MSSKRNIFLLVILSLVIAKQSFSQTREIDSLTQILIIQKQKRDTARVNWLYKVALAHFKVGSEKSKEYLRQTQVLSDSLDHTLGKAKVAYLSGIFESQKSRYEESLVFFNKSLAYYQKTDDKRGLASVYNAFGITHLVQGQYDEAYEDYMRAYDIFEEIGDEENLLRILTNLANVYNNLGRYDEAIEMYEKIISRCEIMNNEAGVATNLYNNALIIRLQGNYPLAISYFNRVLNYHKKVGDTMKMSSVYNAMGDTYRSFGKLEIAKEYHLKSIRFAQLKSNEREYATGHLNLGNIHSVKGEIDSAIYHFEIALEIAKRINVQDDIVVALLNLGTEYQAKEDFETALSYFEKSFQLSDSIQYKRGVCISEVCVGEIYFEQTKYNQAFDFASKGYEKAKELGLLDVQTKALKVIQEVHQKRGDFEKALYVYQEYKILSDSLINKEKIEKVAQIEYEYLYQHQLDSAKIRELRLTKTVSDTNKNLEKSKRNLLWAIISILAIVLVGAIVIFSLRLRNLNTKSQNIITEQKLLRSQMTPHFIFNSLSVLQGMILNNEDDKSINYLSKFSRLLRITLENSRDKMVPLNQELLAIKNYLELQNLEDKNYLYKIEVDEVLSNTELKIPPMLIQPFIENSIEHAFVNHTGEKEIEVHLQLKNDELICSIADNGIGINHSEKKVNHSKKSLSTTITSERLKMMSKHFNKSASVKVEDREQFDEKGTLVTLVIPYTNNFSS